jgi:hypothetical protein
MFRLRLNEWYDDAPTMAIEPLAQPHRSDLPVDDQVRARRCEKLVAQGRIGDAIEALVSDDVSVSEATVEQIARLQAKHPPRQMSSFHDEERENPGPNTEVLIERECLVECIRSFKKGTSPGRSACSALHLLRALECPDEETAENFTSALLSLILYLARGDIPDPLRLFITGARLVGIPKKNDDLRPIAIGETLRRLTAKCLLKQNYGVISGFFAPHGQMGLCTPGGLEAIVHSVRAWTHERQNDPSLVCLKVDLSNAFNNVSRDFFLREVDLHFPSIAPYAHLCYDKTSYLTIGSASISSEEGCQQGDPLGPFLFCLALQELVLQAKNIPGLQFQAWYLDDGCLVGSHEAINAVIDLLETRGPERGMFLNRGPGKSELFWPNLDESNSILPSDIDRPATLSLLGTDISNPPNQPTKLRKMMDRLRIVNAPTAFVLLRDCVQATSTHLLRTTPPNQLQSWCAAADRVITGGLEFIAGSALPASKAPLHSIGIRLPSQTAPAAYFGSRMQFQEITDRLAGMRIPIELPYSLQTVDIPRKHVQRALSTAIMNQEMDAWNSSAPGPVVKFLSTIDAPSDWLRHLFRFKISPSHFQIILQLR